MPIVPAIKSTNLSKAIPELPELEVRITVDYSTKVRAIDEDSAVEQVWEEIMNEGAWGLEITGQEGNDGAM